MGILEEILLKVKEIYGFDYEVCNIEYVNIFFMIFILIDNYEIMFVVLENMIMLKGFIIE